MSVIYFILQSVKIRLPWVLLSFRKYSNISLMKCDIIYLIIITYNIISDILWYQNSFFLYAADMKSQFWIRYPLIRFEYIFDIEQWWLSKSLSLFKGCSKLKTN